MCTRDCSQRVGGCAEVGELNSGSCHFLCGWYKSKETTVCVTFEIQENHWVRKLLDIRSLVVDDPQFLKWISLPGKWITYFDTWFIRYHLILITWNHVYYAGWTHSLHMQKNQTKQKDIQSTTGPNIGKTFRAIKKSVSQNKYKKREHQTRDINNNKKYYTRFKQEM